METLEFARSIYFTRYCNPRTDRQCTFPILARLMSMRRLRPSLTVQWPIFENGWSSRCADGFSAEIDEIVEHLPRA